MNTLIGSTVFFVSFLFFLPLNPALAQTPPNTITFDNQSGEFVIVKLVGPTTVVVEVPDDQKNTVNVSGGDYYILGRYGKFPGSYKYTKGDTFKVNQTERQYSAITITLHKVIDGNYHSKSVSGEEFESLEIYSARKSQQPSNSDDSSHLRSFSEEGFEYTEEKKDAANQEIILGSVEGFLIWKDDARPVTRAKVRLVNKIFKFKEKNPFYPDFKRQVVVIHPDANIREVEVNEQGTFLFQSVPPGNYFIFYQAPDGSWKYSSRQSKNVGLKGDMSNPDMYQVNGGLTTRTIIEISK